jgi:MFS family permease
MANRSVNTQNHVASGAAGLGTIFRGLRSRNYRLFFGGQSISLIGTWMTRTATAWLVYRLTDSALLLGVVGFAGQIPLFVLAPIAGVYVDRWNRHRTLVVTQVLSMLQSLMLAFLALEGIITVGEIIALSAFQGAINAFDMPARQSLVIEMVEQREDLGNAIALNSSMVNGSRMIGPSLAGIVIAGWGEGWCFLFDGISYLAVIFSLLAMLLPQEPRTRRAPRGPWEGLKEGFRYALGPGPIRPVLLLLATMSLMGMPYAVLVPVFARDILHGGSHTYGFLMAASGLGAIVGALYLASRRSVRGISRIIIAAGLMFSLALLGFAWSRLAWLSFALMIPAGAGMMMIIAASNTVLQTIVEDDKRGRVMSFYAMAFQGMLPFGSLLAGGLGARIGAPPTLAVGGICCLLGLGLFARKVPALREMVRPIYLKWGLAANETSAASDVTAIRRPQGDELP